MDEGDFAHVSCVVTKGDMPLTIRWTLHGEESGDGDLMGATANSGISTSQSGPRANFLSIASVGPQHRGIYTCTATNEAGSTVQSTRLRVNGEMSFNIIWSGGSESRCFKLGKVKSVFWCLPVTSFFPSLS